MDFNLMPIVKLHDDSMYYLCYQTCSLIRVDNTTMSLNFEDRSELDDFLKSHVKATWILESVEAGYYVN